MPIYSKEELQILVKDYLTYEKKIPQGKSLVCFRSYKYLTDIVKVDSKWFQDLKLTLGFNEISESTYKQVTQELKKFIKKIPSNVVFSDTSLRYLVKNYVFSQFTDDLALEETNIIAIKYLVNHSSYVWVQQLLKVLKVTNVSDNKQVREALWKWWFKTNLPTCSTPGCSNTVSLKTFFKPNKICDKCIKDKYSESIKHRKNPNEFNTLLFIGSDTYPQHIKNFIRDKLTYINKNGVLVLKPRWKIFEDLPEFRTFLDATKFIPWDGTTQTLSRKIYCVLHNLTREPKCAYSKCNNIAAFKGLHHGYSKFCGANKGCNVKHEIEDLGKTLAMNQYDSIRKREKTKRKVFLEKYGVDNPMKLPHVKQKVSQKNKEFFKLPEFK